MISFRSHECLLLFLFFFCFPSSCSYSATVHRGHAPDPSRKRIVLFWFSYDKAKLDFGPPDCEKEQMYAAGWYKDNLELTAPEGAAEGLFMWRNHLPKFSDLRSEDLNYFIVSEMLKNIQEVFNICIFIYLFIFCNFFFFLTEHVCRCTIRSRKEVVHEPCSSKQSSRMSRFTLPSINTEKESQQLTWKKRESQAPGREREWTLMWSDEEFFSGFNLLLCFFFCFVCFACFVFYFFE